MSNRPPPLDRPASFAPAAGRPPVSLSLRKKLLFAAITTLAVFAALELSLAVLGVEPLRVVHDPYVGFAAAPHFELKPAFGESPRWRTTRHKLTAFNEQNFAARKSGDAIRVFCVGGSTTYGRPYADATSYVGWLRHLLVATHPDLNWEVVNAGGISYASYRVAALVDELVAHKPDLLIVYTGHNEFLEERTYGHLKTPSRPQKWLAQVAANSRIAALLRPIVVTEAPWRPQIGTDVDEILDHTIGPSSYRRDPQGSRQIAAHYEFSLRRMISTARDAGTEVLLIRPACNLRGISPFKSVGSEQLDRDTRSEFNRLFDQARGLQAAGNHVAAIAVLARAVALDDRHAELHFALGQSQFATGDYSAAHTSFQQAVDLDVCPLRITTELDTKLREVARQMQTPLIDFPKLIAAVCRSEHGHAIAGDEYFFDHVHPNIDTHGLLAREIVTRLIDEGLIPPASEPLENRFEATRQQILASVTVADRVAARANLARVLYWAGKFAEAGRIAVDLLEQGHATDDSRLLLIAGLERLQQGENDAAAELLHRARRLQPNDPRISAARRRLPRSDE